MAGMHSNRKVSVIVPAYNAQNGIRATMDALVGQSLPDLEIVCVDDGSADGTGGILDGYAREHPRVRVVHTGNQGAFRARETGIEHATGGYIAFCDAGDVPDGTMYEALLHAALSSGAGVAVCGYRRLNGQGEGAEEMTGFGDAVLPVDAGSGWLVSVNTSLWNKLIRADVLQNRVSLACPPRVMEDAMLLMSVYPEAGKMAFVPQALYSYNVEEGSAMARVEPAEIDALFDGWAATRAHAAAALPGFERIVDLAVFVHMGLSAQLRLVMEEDHASTALCRSIDRMIDDQFPLHRNSPFVTRGYVAGHPSMRNVRLAHLAYSAHVKTAALKAYGFLVKRNGMKSTW